MNKPSSGAVDPLRVKFFIGNIKMYLQFISFIHIDIAEILPRLMQELTYSTYSQYHGCWYPGDARSQAINSIDIDYVEPD